MSFTFAPGSLGEYPVDIPGLPEQTIQIPNQETQIDSAKDFTTLVTARVALPVSQQYRLGLGVEQKEVQEDRAGQQLRSTRQSTAQNAKDLYFSILRSEAALRATRASVVYLQGLSGVVARNVQQRR